MEEKLYQNIDLPQNNPLNIPEEATKEIPKKPLNPKVFLLIALGFLIFLLLVTSLIVTKIRQQNLNSNTIPTIVPITPTPTTNDSIIPTQYQEDFKNLEKSFEEDPDLPAPQIDIEVGL